MPDSLNALRRANPRMRPGFASSVEASGHAVGERLAAGADGSPTRRARPRRLLGASALAAALATGAVLVGVLAPGSSTTEDAAAALRTAATATATSAEKSGTAVVRITHGGEPWAGTTILWNGGDLSLTGQPMPGAVGPRKTGSTMLLVDGMMYGIDPEDGGWVVLGSPRSIDPGSGTTPAEYLAAVREDVGGTTLRRILDGITGLETTGAEDGSVTYSGRVAAGLIARESGFKEGRTVRVLPFGYVANGDADDPAAPVDVRVTVGADGLVRELVATWNGSDGAWRYAVAYSGLGATDVGRAPADAEPLRERRDGS